MGYIWALEVYNVLQMYVSKALPVVKLVVRVYILSNFYYSCFSVKQKHEPRRRKTPVPKKPQRKPTVAVYFSQHMTL